MRWRTRIVILLVGAIVAAVAVYATRRTLMLDLARLALNHQSELVAQERADGVAIVFSQPPSPWITPMKNQMNDIWAPLKAAGVNYYTFAGPRTWLASFSERSNPSSPYYQAWVGAYVIKPNGATLPDDLQSLAWQVTSLDQRSWLSVMHDPKPIADPTRATSAGNVMIDGRDRPLWHGTMHSHSDLSAQPTGPLAPLIGMPAQSSWPSGVDSFHDVTLDGYFACWPDSQQKVLIVVYAVSASYQGQAAALNGRTLTADELLVLMKSAKVEVVH